MTAISLLVNGAKVEVDVEPEMPLLWVLRDVLQLTGTKYGCGISECGACTVLVDGAPVKTCMLPVSDVAGTSIRTIEGLSTDRSHRVQQAWIAEQVPQCGYCQSGQILSAVALLEKHPRPDDSQIDAAMDPVLCRCGTYGRVRRAIHRAARGE